MRLHWRWLLSLVALFVCVASTQRAIQGWHQPTNNVGYLGTALAGVEGVAGSGSTVAVLGTGSSGAMGQLGTSQFGVAGIGAPGGTGVWGTGSTGVASQGSSTGVMATGGIVGVNAVGDCGTPTCVYATTGLYASGFRGIEAHSTNDQTGSGAAIQAYATGWATGIGAHAENGWAGSFGGDVRVTGLLTKSAGAFKIDHPLEPATKYLSHSFVESPDMKNIYDGIVTLERDGTATVELPRWFGALNIDYRYQLTCIGENAPVYIAKKIEDNKFMIAGGYQGMEVSWQVTGIRNDVFAKAHRILVEEGKSPSEAGRYLHPDLYGQPMTMQIGHMEPNRGVNARR